MLTVFKLSAAAAASIVIAPAEALKFEAASASRLIAPVTSTSNGPPVKAYPAVAPVTIEIPVPAASLASRLIASAAASSPLITTDPVSASKVRSPAKVLKFEAVSASSEMPAAVSI